MSAYVKFIRRARWLLCAGSILIALGGHAAMDVRAAEPEAPISRINHYTNDEGAFGFVLDRSTRPSVMRFDASSEILVLTSVPGPRGDTIYKRDNGVTILRQTLIGGMTLFDASRPNGLPVMKDRESDALVLPLKSPAQIRARALVLADRLSVKLNRDITFKMNWTATSDDRQALTTLADALEMAGIALTRIAEDGLGREALAANLSQVIFMPGDAARAELQAKSLVITYDGAKGVQGRLSSDALARYLESAL